MSANHVSYFSSELIEIIETMNTSEFTEVLLDAQSFLKPQAVRLTRNEDQAKDLIQETMLKAVANFKRFEQRNEHSLESWLFVIMKNTFLTQCRKQKRRRTAMGKLEGTHNLSAVHPRTFNEGDNILAHEEIERASTEDRAATDSGVATANSDLLLF